MNSVTLIGRLIRDPELKYLPNTGTAVSTFTLAVDKGLSREKRSEMELKNQPTADFIRIVAWGKVAENCANFLIKGKLVGVSGRIQTGSYEKDGQKIYTTEVIANSVEFLERADSTNKPNTHSNDDDDFFNGIDGFHPVDNEPIPF